MFPAKTCFVVLFLIFSGSVAGSWAQQGPAAPKVTKVKTVEVAPATGEAEVGQKIHFTAMAMDASGAVLDDKPTAWFAAPFDLATADDSGTVEFYGPGEVRVGAIIGGKPGFAKIVVKPAAVKNIDVAPVAARVVVGGTVKLDAVARMFNGNPRSDVIISWTSANPSVATVDAAGVVTGVSPGKASVRATSSAGGSGAATIEVEKSTIKSLAIEPRSTNGRTGDVIRFKARAEGSGEQARNPSVHWTVSGQGAAIEGDGGFVAELPGTYVVTAASGPHQATASVVIVPRNIEREMEIVGRAPVKDFQAPSQPVIQTAEQWIVGNYAYLSTISDRVLVYDVSDPAHPKLTDTVKVDARLVNDVSTTADGHTGVITREGASSRKNGIALLDTTDLAHPKLVSEYTATVTGGVHSAFINGHYAYITDDATGSLRIIDFANVKAPREVARWQVENQVANTVHTAEGERVGGRYLHDVYVKDGLAYLAYWRDGLVILDVGSGVKGGSPEKPQFVSQLRFNHHELYGNGWLAGAHAVFRYKNYVYVGDEVFPELFNLQSRQRIPVRGVLHVIDVSDLERPRKVAEYAVPEAGAHNVWVEDDILYMGYYNGGGRVLDVSGELRGDLYRQGREIARLWTGDPEGYRPNLPFCWGAQPHNGLIFFNDIHSGLWIVKLGKPRQKGSTTEPAN
jgi:hypothetical protein